MEETKGVSVKGIALKYGAISGLISIIIFVMIDFAGMVGSQILGYLPVLAMAVIMYFAHKEYIREGDDHMSYSEGLGIGTLLSVVASVISSIFTFFYVSYINTNYITNMLEVQRENFVKQGMSQAQIDQSMSITESMMSPVGLLIFGILVTVFIGFIISLIVSAITKKSRPEFE